MSASLADRRSGFAAPAIKTEVGAVVTEAIVGHLQAAATGGPAAGALRLAFCYAPSQHALRVPRQAER